jgi:hypothetical protein
MKGEALGEKNNDSDAKIRRYLVEQGLIFPITDDEIEFTIQQMEKEDLDIPDEIADFKRFSNQLDSEKNLKERLFPKEENDNIFYLDQMAMAARNGKGEIPEDILEQMKKDSEESQDDQ